ncbi:hypothetical protein V5O48_005510 [Marasmius crinis-equi]|uniref:F-box domain-containing protein n=1 Tax=Marasmius crinis-equi TaxID=585013 RepID=A0ABR3FM50_9AGAR
MSPMFLLPNELIENIALRCSDTRNLRLVNRRVYEAVEHVLWNNGKVKLYIDEKGLREENLQMLEDLKNGCKGTGSIRMLHLISPYSFALDRVRLLHSNLLPSAIQAMESLRSVEWKIRWKSRDPALPLAETTVFRSLASLSSIRELTLDCRTIPSFPVDVLHFGNLETLIIRGEPTAHDVLLSSLSKILARNPKISYLELIWAHVIQPMKPAVLPFSTLFQPPLPHLLPLHTLNLSRWIFDFVHANVIPHLRSLRSLSLYLCEYEDQTLPKALAMQQVSLRRIRVQSVSGELFDYLESIVGLEELSLSEFEDPSESQQLSQGFHDSVLPRHRHTLRVLCVEPLISSPDWAIGYHNIRILDSCAGLAQLTVGLYFEDVHDHAKRKDLLVSTLHFLSFVVATYMPPYPWRPRLFSM